MQHHIGVCILAVLILFVHIGGESRGTSEDHDSSALEISEEESCKRWPVPCRPQDVMGAGVLLQVGKNTRIAANRVSDSAEEQYHQDVSGSEERDQEEPGSHWDWLDEDEEDDGLEPKQSREDEDDNNKDPWHWLHEEEPPRDGGTDKHLGSIKAIIQDAITEMATPLERRIDEMSDRLTKTQKEVEAAHVGPKHNFSNFSTDVHMDDVLGFVQDAIAEQVAPLREQVDEMSHQLASVQTAVESFYDNDTFKARVQEAIKPLKEQDNADGINIGITINGKHTNHEVS